MITDYNLFFKFIESYSKQGFSGVDPEDPFIKELEEILEKNRQFFYVGDLIKLKILYTSYSVFSLLGINPGDIDPRVIFDITHPDDLDRHGSVRSRVFREANELFMRGEDYKVMSTNLMFRTSQNDYINFLNQAYMWPCFMPVRSVCCIFVQTDISWFGEIRKGYHAYNGNDLSKFRYPDKELIMTGYMFSDREYEIIKLIGSGLNSEEISEKIFLSPHTVNTHRRNILKKSNKATMNELIHDMQERGLL
jgi:hypothetical protein